MVITEFKLIPVFFCWIFIFSPPSCVRTARDNPIVFALRWYAGTKPSSHSKHHHFTYIYVIGNDEFSYFDLTLRKLVLRLVPWNGVCSAKWLGVNMHIACALHLTQMNVSDSCATYTQHIYIYVDPTNKGWLRQVASFIYVLLWMHSSGASIYFV